MKNVMAISNWIASVTIFFCALHQSLSLEKFLCSSERTDPPLPDLPQAYSTDMRVNFYSEKYTVEVKNAIKTIRKDGKDFHNELLEFKTADRRVKYIIREDLKSVLVITYKDHEHPKCVIKKTLDVKEFMESEDVGPSEIILKTVQAVVQHAKFNPAGGNLENGIEVKKWEGCFSDPKINVSLSISDSSWKQSHVSSSKTNNYMVSLDAEVGKYTMTALYSNFDPTTPDDILFQPPEDVYCDSFNTDKSPPKILNYFSYDCEILTYETAAGVQPIVTRRKVYYDYPAGISRIDFYDALAEDSKVTSPIRAQKKSIIHDFNAGIQYSFDPFTGRCSLDAFKSTFSVISSEKTKDGLMLKGNEFFWLDNTKLSYNGQFPVRGLMADVYTASKIDPQTKKKSVVSWYFSTEDTQVVETENVEKNVLLRMTVRPETAIDKESTVIVNLYNFANEEPNVLTLDITSCYNETYSKILVLTFPAHDSLRGSEKLIGMLTHLAIKVTTGVSKQRIYVNEIVFSGNYMYTEFDFLEAPALSGKPANSAEISLDAALDKLRNAIKNNQFFVNIPAGSESIKLIPEPDGLNVFAGDRVRKVPSETGYKEGSVISLTIGMLILGFLVGIVMLNLIMSKKFGVSLFQKSKYGNQPFDSEGESSM